MNKVESLWHNGGRMTVLSLGVFMIVALSLTALNVYLVSSPDEPYNPLRYSHPQIINGSKVLHPGDEFTVHRIKCNDGDEILAVVGHSDWRQIGPSGDVIGGTPYRSSSIPLILPPHECNERDGLNQIPLDMKPGTYILEGTDCVTPGFKICRAWETEKFEVIP